MRIYKPRGLNIDESYACSRTALRKCFGEWDISVYWGEPEQYSFNKCIKKPPKIDGCVVASMQLNFRKRIPLAELRFYVIRDARYDGTQQDVFEEKVLSLLHDWLTETKEQLSAGKSEEILVIWQNGRFFTQEIHMR